MTLPFLRYFRITSARRHRGIAILPRTIFRASRPAEHAASGACSRWQIAGKTCGRPDDSFVLGSGMIPVLFRRSRATPDLAKGNRMRVVSTHEATRLTGLSTDQLREWTSRRAIIPADIKPKGNGSAAQFSWQTILVIRLAAALRTQFRVELQAHRSLFASLRRGLHGVSFIALWDKRLAICSSSRWLLLDASSAPPEQQDAIVLCLAPHLEVLSAGFALPRPSMVEGQPDLFPAQGLSASRSHARAASAASTSPTAVPGKHRATA